MDNEDLRSSLENQVDIRAPETFHIEASLIEQLGEQVERLKETNVRSDGYYREAGRLEGMVESITSAYLEEDDATD